MLCVGRNKLAGHRPRVNDRQGDLLTPADSPVRWYALSDSKVWRTPEWFLELVRQLGVIGLDPCSNPDSLVHALVEYMLERGENGLAHSWRGHGLVFVNPPYGRDEIEPFLLKAWREFHAITDGDQCILLVPANTDTAWFQRYCSTASALCFYGKTRDPRSRSRIQFLPPVGKEVDPKDNTSTVANLVVYWGAQVELFRATFSPYGWVP